MSVPNVPDACSFCGRAPPVVAEILRARSGATICNECVLLAYAMLEQQSTGPGTGSSRVAFLSKEAISRILHAHGMDEEGKPTKGR